MPQTDRSGAVAWGTILSSSPIQADRNAVASAFSTRDNVGRIKDGVPAGLGQRPTRLCLVGEHLLSSITEKAIRDYITQSAIYRLDQVIL